jgi:hypothetical protein
MNFHCLQTNNFCLASSLGKKLTLEDFFMKKF